MGSAQAAEDVWTGSAELGLILTTGNTETQSTSGKLDFHNERDKWRHTINLAALQIDDNKADSTIAEKYSAKGKSAYKFSDLDYAFAELAGEHDKFSGYDYSASLVAGYGRKLMNKADMRLDVEAGPGFRRIKPDTEEAVNEAVAQIFGKFEWDISKTAMFSQEVSSQYGFDDGLTVSKAVSGLKSQINGDLSMKATLTLRHISDVAPGVEELDTETAVTLVYSF